MKIEKFASRNKKLVYGLHHREDDGRSRKGSTFTVLCIRKYLKEMRMFHKSVSVVSGCLL